MVETDVFFGDYAAASIGGNPAALAAFYSKNVVAVGPAGSMVFANDENFLKWLNDVHAFNQQTGLQQMLVRNIKAHAVGKNLVHATVTWGAVYKKTQNRIIEFDIHYMLEIADQAFKILLFVSDEDQQQLMEKEGIL